MRSTVMVTALLIFCLVIFVSTMAQAAIYMINPDGSGDFPTIQAAINSANDGDIIQLSNGTFTGPGNRDLDTDETNVTIESLNGDPSLCVIDCQGSSADPHYGIEYSALDASTFLRGITITNGYGSEHGGALRLWNANIIVENCIFSNNTAWNFGGAVYAVEESSPSFLNCIFQNNSADYYGLGGAVFAQNVSSPVFEGCVFSGNQAHLGGAIYSEYECTPMVSSSTFWNNSHEAAHMSTDCTLTIAKSILAFNEGYAITGSDNGAANLICSNIFGNPSGNWAGILSGQAGINSNIETHPLLCDPTGGDFSLHSQSPCAPDNSPCGLMGAMPVGCSGPLLVEADGSGLFSNIQEALDAIPPFGVIELGTGSFYGPGNVALVMDKAGVTLISSGEDSWIDCGETTYGIYISANSISISGVRIINGSSQYDGGGIKINNCSPNLNNVTIEDCVTTNWGGGLSINQGSPEISGGYISSCSAFGGGGVTVNGGYPTFNNVKFSANVASNSGAGAWLSSSNATFNDCEFVNNRATGSASGGGAYLQTNCQALFERCEFRGNTASSGGGVRADNDQSTFNYCIYRENQATSAGGGASVGGTSTTTFDHNTFFRNESTEYGGSGIYCGSNAAPNITNTVIAWGVGGQGFDSSASTQAVITCSDIFANEGGDWVDPIDDQFGLDGNISADPQLLLGESGGINVSNISPCGPYVNPGCGSIGAGLVMPGRPHYVVNADGTGMLPTIQDAIDMVPEDAVVELAAGVYTGDGNRDLSLGSKAILITAKYYPEIAPVEIDLQGTMNDPHRFAHVTSVLGKLVEISNLEIHDGWIDGNGGALLIGGRALVNDGINLTNCTFNHNHVSGNGGAIYAYWESKPDFLNCTFSTNTADESSMAVYLEGKNGDFSDCIFTNHLSGVGRSVVEIWGNAAGTDFDHCSFLNNDGGVVIVANEEFVFGNPWFNRCIFDNENTTDLQLSSNGFIDPNILNCEFRNSETALHLIGILGATISNTNFSGTDRALRLYQSWNIDVHGCDFLDGTGPLENVSLKNSLASFTSCQFNNNSHTGDGGALSSDSSTVEFDQCHFSDNQATGIGGGAYFQYSNASFTDSYFNTNTAVDGGGLYSEMSNLTVDSCFFNGNSDGLRHHGSSYYGVTLTGTSFSNHSSGWGAEIDSTQTSPVIVNDSVFSSGSQGLRLLDVPDFRVANTEFINNPGNRTLSISSAVGVIDTCSFTGNSASSEGGALYMLGSNVSLAKCVFSENSSALSGGAVHVQSGEAEFDHCQFTGNHAAEHGGALSGFAATATMENCSFTGNTADETGGSIYTNDVATSVIQCTISDGSAGSVGGGAYHRYGTTTYSGGLVNGNSGSSGGGIAASLSNTNLNGLTISGNNANSAGGASIFASDLLMNNCAIEGNIAASTGGIHLYNNSTGQINSTVIANNTSSTSGSGLTVDNEADLSIFETTIVGNGGAGSSGQVFCNLNSTVALNSSMVAFATHGPAAAINDESCSITAEASNVFGNASGDWVGPLLGHGDLTCNFSLDPQFCDMNAGDYHLTGSSPCAPDNSSCGQLVGALTVGCSGTSPVQESDLPTIFAVRGNHPNPFNPRTNISFELPTPDSVVVEIYDVTGRLVRRLVQGENYPAGNHLITWNGNDDLGQTLSSGIYLYRVHASGQSLGGKMTMIR
ncbi:MAG: T9SS type A sorting domain-containing protein [bacterium]|nr:T9SS type A sorting domain-containing protein [bacterium]